jgi:hypothetical protein
MRTSVPSTRTVSGVAPWITTWYAVRANSG